jgi:hypothetical protein
MQIESEETKTKLRQWILSQPIRKSSEINLSLAATETKPKKPKTKKEKSVEVPKPKEPNKDNAAAIYYSATQPEEVLTRSNSHFPYENDEEEDVQFNFSEELDDDFTDNNDQTSLSWDWNCRFQDIMEDIGT